MPLRLSSRADFTLATFQRVAWEGEGAVFAKSALRRMAQTRRQFLALLDSDPEITIYGVTSGYGQMASKRLTPAERKKHARTPPHGAMVAFGIAVPERVARGIVFARLANYVEGHAAISPELASAVAELLDGRKLPAVSLEGQGGAGEILGLAPLFNGLAERFELGEKECLSLINGSPCASALIADSALAARRRLALAEEVFALSCEAIRAPLGHFGEELEGLWGDPAESATLQRLRRLMAGGSAQRRPYQAPVSFRVLPRVLAQFRRATEAAETAAETSLKAVTDNPVFLAPTEAAPMGRVYSTGGYHNAMAHPAMDNLAAAMADLCLLADRHVSKLLHGAHSLLPDQLRKDEGYLGCFGMVQVGYAEQARRAAQRNFLPGSEGGGFGQNDVSPPSFPAWRSQDEAGRCLDATLAVLAAVGSQALFATDRDPPRALAPLVHETRRHLPPVTKSRVLAQEAMALAAALGARVFTA
ncbi:MAG TPA: aromatic amino acid lyase [Candidatus Udaeobacter sp.]|nr:aromatic amino acid lyase [Candidatus Udaeobacter sp.]